MVSCNIVFSLSKKKCQSTKTENVFLFQPCTCSGMCSLYTFFFSFFSFVHAPECAYCTPILYTCHIIQFVFCFTQARNGSCHVHLFPLFFFMPNKDSVKHTCIYIYIYIYMFVICIYLKKKKNKPSFGLGKNLKVMPQLSCYLSFLLGKGGKTLYLKPYCKNFKNTQVHLLTNPYNALV